METVQISLSTGFVMSVFCILVIFVTLYIIAVVLELVSRLLTRKDTAMIPELSDESDLVAIKDDKRMAAAVVTVIAEYRNELLENGNFRTADIQKK